MSLVIVRCVGPSITSTYRILKWFYGLFALFHGLLCAQSILVSLLVSFLSLGTINHILGLCMGELGHTLLHEAHHSYSLAQATIPTLAPFSDIIRLFLSNQNNQMVIYQEFAMHNESKACLQLLRDLLAVIPSFYSMGNSGLEPCDVLDHEILLNLMVMTRTVVAPAA